LKSQLFSKFDAASEKNAGFKHALDECLKISSEYSERIINKLPDIWFAATKKQSEQEISDLVGSMKDVNPISVRSVVSFFAFLADNLKEQEELDSSEDLVGDLTDELHLLDNENKDKLLNLLSKLRDTIVSTGSESLKREYEAGLFPSFSGIGTTVELRAVQKDRYSPVESINDYSPVIADVIGLVSINIRLDTEDDLYFQASRSDLELIIDSLRAAKMDLDALGSYKS